MAHDAGSLVRLGVEQARVDALWDCRESELFSVAERLALDFTMAASSMPHAVTDAMFAQMRTYWNDKRIVDIVGVISLLGFTNRFNDTTATPLEAEPTEGRAGAVAARLALRETRTQCHAELMR